MPASRAFSRIYFSAGNKSLAKEASTKPPKKSNPRVTADLKVTSGVGD